MQPPAFFRSIFRRLLRRREGYHRSSCIPAGLLFERKREDKAGGADIALCFDAPLVLGRNGGGDGKPKAKAALLPSGGVCPVKPLKQMGKLGGRNGLAGVTHRQPGLAVCLLEGEGNGSACRAVFNGVVQQNRNRPVELVPLPQKGQILREMVV